MLVLGAPQPTASLRASIAASLAFGNRKRTPVGRTQTEWMPRRTRATPQGAAVDGSLHASGKLAGRRRRRAPKLARRRASLARGYDGKTPISANRLDGIDKSAHDTVEARCGSVLERCAGTTWIPQLCTGAGRDPGKLGTHNRSV